jgi:threonyl-tRNA synthetase
MLVGVFLFLNLKEKRMKITLLDGSTKEIPNQSTVREVASSIATSLGKATVGAILNHQILVPSDFVLDQDYHLQLITNKDEQNYELVVSTTAAAISSYALKTLFNDVKISQLFYKNDELEFAFTFSKDENLKLEQLSDVQNKVNQVLQQDLIIKNQTITSIEGLAFNEYETYLANQLIANQGFAIMTIINDQNFIFDKPVYPNKSLVKVIKLTQLTGSY